MPRGNNVTLASGTGNLYKTLTGGDRATLLILNPNDGIVYVTINAQASPAVWDFIVPSQSRAYLPGPWLTYGLYFLDQSGASHSGNITIFESDTQLLLPDYGSIGRALQAQVTTVDIVEGAQPGNPAVGIGRLWIDNTGRLQVLLSDGTNERLPIAPIPSSDLVALTQISAQLASDISVAAFIAADISISLPPGTWLIIGQAAMTLPAAGAFIGLALYNATAGVYVSSQESGFGNSWGSLAIYDILVLSATSTITLRAESTGAAVLKATDGFYTAPPTRISGVRLA